MRFLQNLDMGARASRLRSSKTRAESPLPDNDGRFCKNLACNINLKEKNGVKTMSSRFEIPARDKITFTAMEDWVSITQECQHVEEQRVTIHIDDLQKVIEFLSTVAETSGKSAK